MGYTKYYCIYGGGGVENFLHLTPTPWRASAGGGARIIA